ncbi:MAG: glycoside hydrolase family 9 protein, partial [Candidatus Omnitrophica bacterium]|nr:glycoside hydrolase family 9 protein [Candidatus Omnitrophota bacterium]
LSARTFEDEPAFAGLLRAHAANQVHWVLGLNPLDLCMLEGVGSSSRIHYHHLLAESPDHPRGAVPGAIPNGIAREPGNSDRPWFDFRDKIGSLPGAETCEPWLPHNAFFLLMLSAEL